LYFIEVESNAIAHVFSTIVSLMYYFIGLPFTNIMELVHYCSLNNFAFIFFVDEFP